jgi:NADH dehydrogenase
VTTANSARRGGEDTVERVDRAGNRSLIEAARGAGVKQFVFVSALGARSDNPVPFLQAKAETEAHLRASGMPWTVLAPNAFMEPWLGMIVVEPIREGAPVTLVGEGRRRHTFVLVANVAAFAAAAVGHPAAMNRHLSIGGPEALSWREIVAICERLLGRSIPMRSVALGEPLPGFPPLVAQLMAAMETYETPLDMEETARTFGVRLTKVEEFLEKALVLQR